MILLRGTSVDIHEVGGCCVQDRAVARMCICIEWGQIPRFRAQGAAPLTSVFLVNSFVMHYKHARVSGGDAKGTYLLDTTIFLL